MTINYAPFSTAQAHLLEAAQWLQDLLLPSGHPDRVCVDFAEGQRRAVREIACAITSLECSAQHSLGDQSNASARPAARLSIDRLDQEPVDAAKAIAELTFELRVSTEGCRKFAANQAFIDILSTLLDRSYPARLSGEAVARELLLALT